MQNTVAGGAEDDEERCCAAAPEWQHFLLQLQLLLQLLQQSAPATKYAEAPVAIHV